MGHTQREAPANPTKTGHLPLVPFPWTPSPSPSEVSLAPSLCGVVPVRARLSGTSYGSLANATNLLIRRTLRRRLVHRPRFPPSSNSKGVQGTSGPPVRFAPWSPGFEGATWGQRQYAGHALDEDCGGACVALGPEVSWCVPESTTFWRCGKRGTLTTASAVPLRVSFLNTRPGARFFTLRTRLQPFNSISAQTSLNDELLSA